MRHARDCDKQCLMCIQKNFEIIGYINKDLVCKLFCLRDIHIVLKLEHQIENKYFVIVINYWHSYNTHNIII